ncbi:hypothetical protein [Helicobacter sp. 11S02596-1]|uniref:hypothetical protein n=1 Tax=Helicobacter sp. 11S02596-1 TaxID=1476194 RepID=UPI000BA7A62A|nr:hypothetical protein [Helicobacter sp. 11S02596-1]PAF42780.1 hypothetical protein BJI48_05835 [Helicobacter sp. 11S02596-1]
MKKLFKKFIPIIVFASCLITLGNAFGIEEKTGNTYAFQFGYTFNNETSLPDNTTQAITSNGKSTGFAFALINGYEIFFTPMHGLKISLDTGFQYLSANNNTLSMIYKKQEYLFDFSLNLDYRIDFYHSGNWDIGAFGGGGYGYSIDYLNNTPTTNALYEDFVFSEVIFAGGYNLQAGFIFTNKNKTQLEINIKYKNRSSKQADISNLATYASIGWKF